MLANTRVRAQLPERLKWSNKRVALLFGSLNTFFFFIAFVVVAGGLPPCWKKENNAGIGAPASTGFIGTARPILGARHLRARGRQTR